jgi:hypothetical protein
VLRGIQLIIYLDAIHRICFIVAGVIILEEIYLNRPQSVRLFRLKNQEMTSSAEGIEPKRSEEYSKLLEELRNSFVSAANMSVKLYEQGKKDGLSNEEIRKDIEIALDGIVKERRLGILPEELTRSYTQAITSNSTNITGTETNNQTKEEMTAWKEIRHEVLDRIKKTGSSSNKLQSKSKSKKEITPQQSIALIASIIIIIIAIGGLGIV